MFLVAEKMSEKLIQRYKTKKKVLEKLIEVIDMIENGSSESDACKNVGINKHSFRHFLNADFSFESSFNPYYNDEKEPEEYPTWQDELFSDIMGYEKKQSYYCEGFEQRIEECLNNLSEKEQTIVRYRYMEGYTLSEIGKRLSLSRERVRQILNKALRRLRHPVYCKNLCYGYSIQDHSFITNEEIENKRKELYKLNEKKLIELNTIKKDIEKIKDSNKYENYTDLFNSFCKEKGVESLEKINNLFDNISIESLDLSIRAYNSLKRAGCNTLADLLEIIYSENLLKVRNLGVKSSKEILKVAIDYGADKDKIMSLYLI